MNTRRIVGTALAGLLLAGAGWMARRSPSVPEAAPAKRSSAAATDAPDSLLAPSRFKEAPRRLELGALAGSSKAEAKEELGKAIGLARNGVVKEWDGIYAYNSQALGVTLDHGRIEVSPNYGLEGLGVPFVRYHLSEIQVGGELIARGGSATADADLDHHEISFPRGSVTEKYVLQPEALEQVFLIRELPARGDLAVRGTFETNLTPPAEGWHGPTLALTYRECEVLSLREAVARDAAGRTLSLEMSYRGGEVELTLPAAWVQEATLPIEIDPLIGTPLTLRSSIAGFVSPLNGQFVRVSDLAYNSYSQCGFAVWSERVGASTFDYNIYGQAMNTSGALYGSVISIATTTNGEYECSVCYASAASNVAGFYLVVWREDPSDNSNSSDQRISGRILNWDGSFYTPIFVIDNPPGQNYAPSVAYDTGQWLVTWTHVVSATNHDILGRFVSQAGIPGARIGIDQATDMATRSVVAFDGSQYVVAWEKTSGTVASIVACVVDPDGFVQGPITTISQTSTLDCRLPDISSGDGLFMVVWQQQNSATDHDILGRIFDHTFRFQTPPLTVFGGGTDQLSPRITFNWDNHAWYVAATDTVTGGPDVYGRMVGLTGVSAASVDQLTSGGATEIRPVVAAAPGKDLVFLSYGSGSVAPYALVGQVVGMPTALGGMNSIVGAPDSPSTVRWTWAPGPAGVGFEILDTQNFHITTQPSTATSYIEGGLQSNQTVLRKIRLVSGAQGGPPTAPGTGTTEVGIGTGMGLTALSGWEVKIDVAVPPNGYLGYSGFQVQRSKIPSFLNTDGSLFDEYPGAQIYSFIDSNVQPNTLYYYRYEYITQGGGEGGFGTQYWSITTPNSPPKSLTGTAASANGITWTWPTLATTNGYSLTDQNGNVTASNVQPGVVEGGLPENTQITRTVRSQYTTMSGPSPAASVYTLVHTPLATDWTLSQAVGGIQITVAEPVRGKTGQTGFAFYKSSNNVNWYRSGNYIGVYSFVDGNVTPNTTSYYQLFYLNGDGVPSPVSATKSFTTTSGTPAAPTNLVGTSPNTTQIQWTWTASTSATSYQVFNMDVSPNAQIATTTSPSWLETNLGENTTHYRFVRASDPWGQSANSGYAAVTTIVHNAASGDFSVSAVSQAAVSVSVATPVGSGTGHTFYELSRSTDGTTWTVLAPNSYQWTDGTVAAATTYQYRIRYSNYAGNFSAYSPVKSVTTWGAATPAITTGNKKTRNQNTSLAGTAAVGTTVKIYMNGAYDGTAVNTNGNWTYSTVSKAAGVYTVQAQASNGTALSAFSAPITLTIDLTPPAPPVNLRVQTYHGAIDLEWDPSPSSDVLGYRIFRKTGSTGTWSMILTYPGCLSGTTKYRDVNVVDGTTYFYHVTAVDDSRND